MPLRCGSTPLPCMSYISCAFARFRSTWRNNALAPWYDAFLLLCFSGLIFSPPVRCFAYPYCTAAILYYAITLMRRLCH
nr:MAG TPA: hypothetical protein [Caudoviricetes sp.]